jgi:hypothetical protein
VWDSNTGVTVKILQLNIANIVDGFDEDGGVINTDLGDTPIVFCGTDPANKRADYSGLSTGLDCPFLLKMRETFRV